MRVVVLPDGRRSRGVAPRAVPRCARPRLVVACRCPRSACAGGRNMNDVTSEIATDPALPIPTPEAAAELEAALPEAVASAEVPAERTMPEIEYPVGPVRQAILDHFLDTEGDQ